MILRTLRKIRHRILSDKHSAEVDFWVNEIKEYQKWYSGETKVLWGRPSPIEREKVTQYDLKNNSILTWFNTHQKPKYLEALELAPHCFSGLKLLDIGAGPMPSAMAFEGADLYSLDPLYGRYLSAGFPLHFYGNTKFINSRCEKIPVTDHFFDAVISVNAIDHVDDLEASAAELRRVLKPDGKFAMHVHCHPPKITEPIEINDDIFAALFRWVPGLKKTKESRAITGTELGNSEESYALWRNF